MIIYQLLFGGQTPFAWIGAGETPEINEIIRRGLWLYAPNSLIQPVDRTIPLEIVHPEVQRCFLRCFNDGYKDPNLRPTAGDWVKALRLAVNELTICGKLDSHYYSRTDGTCYWCDRSTKLGTDIFPGKVIPIPKPIVQPNQSQVLQANQSANSPSPNRVSKQSMFKSAVSNSPSLSETFLSAKTWICNTTTIPIQNYAQVIIALVLASIALVSLVNFAASSLFSTSNNSNSAKDERQELIQSELREIANSQIGEYIIGIGISFQLDEKTKVDLNP